MHFSVFKVLADSNKFVGLSKFYFSSYRTYIKGSIMIRLVLLTLYVYKYGILVQDNADIIQVNQSLSHLIVNSMYNLYIMMSFSVYQKPVILMKIFLSFFFIAALAQVKLHRELNHLLLVNNISFSFIIPMLKWQPIQNYPYFFQQKEQSIFSVCACIEVVVYQLYLQYSVGPNHSATFWENFKRWCDININSYKLTTTYKGQS